MLFINRLLFISTFHIKAFKPCIQYRACVADLLRIIMCGIYYCIVCISTLDLVSFLFVPALYPYFHLLVSSLFVLSNVIVEDVVGLCTCTYKKAMVFCSGMYEAHCLPKIVTI